MEFDVVVVGAGLGGLAAGALLAKRGYKVHLIEQHDKVGGFASNFKRKKYRMEVAIHVIDGDHEFNLRNEIFDELNVRENIEFVKLPEFYTCHFDNEKIRVPDSIKDAEEHLSALFPHERTGLRHFFQTMWDVNKSMHACNIRNPRVTPTSPLFNVLFNDLNKLWNTSIGLYIDQLFKDNHLKVALLANVTFYHDNPHEMNIMQYMSSQASYFLGGVYYIKGGSQVYSDYLAKIITDNGGTVSLNHRVENIVLENGRVQEVHYRKTRGPEKEILKTAKAKQFIMNAPLPYVYDLINNYPNPPYADEVRSFRTATTATTLFYGLKSPLKDLGNKSHLNIVVDARQNMQDMSTFDRSVGVVDYDVVETGLCQPGAYSCDVIYMDKFSEWANLSPDDYERKKRIVADFHSKKMEENFPGFRDIVDLVEVGTPKTIVRYTSNPQGACYGFSPEFESYKKRNLFFADTDGITDPHIPNLHFGSAWSYFPGFSGAQIAGARAANAISKKDGRR